MDELNMPEAVEGVSEDIEIRRSTLQVEQKRIFLNLRENSRGRYLRIVEVTGNNRSTIIVPSSGLQQFRTLLDEFIDSDVAVAQGQQAMLPGSGGGAPDVKKKKRRNKKSGGGGGGLDGAGGGLQNGGTEGGESIGFRVFVGNLAWSTQSQALREHFMQCGEIVRADVFTERSGRSRGCGIVEFATEEESRSAMETMSDTVLDGRPIFVREDRH
mmetsp:Transcript_54218/g.113313  ORF Transcript_54218/g.113313 Transcript_54218/m.113313 type:complete len:214 (-) Transcript_54218:62-703(-)